MVHLLAAIPNELFVKSKNIIFRFISLRYYVHFRVDTRRSEDTYFFPYIKIQLFNVSGIVCLRDTL